MKILNQKILFILIFLYSSLAFASGVNFNDTTNKAAPLNSPSFTGNVGIGSTAPGQVLDVNGTARVTGFTLTGNGAGNGYVIVGNSVGVGTWMPAGTLSTSGGSSQWTTINTNDVYLPNNGNVGLGTTRTTTAALTIMNGNVGIGTWVPIDAFQVGKFSSDISGFEVDSNGNVGIGTTITGNSALTIMNGNVGIGTFLTPHNLDVSGTSGVITVAVGDTTAGTLQSPTIYLAADVTNSRTYFDSRWNWPFDILTNNTFALRVDTNQNIGIGTVTPQALLDVTNSGIQRFSVLATGNVGIGSATPGQALDVQGTIRALGEIVNGNVGIGTSKTTTAAMSVMNGNVGVGTWVPSAGLDVETGGNSYFGGNIGIGSTAPSGALDLGSGAICLGHTCNSTWPSTSQWTTINTNDVYLPNNGNVGIGTTRTTSAALTVMNGNVGIGTWIPAASLDVEYTGNSYIGNNLGIGSTAPAGALDVGSGSICLGHTCNSTWPSTSQWTTINTNDVYLPNNGNVGIGTTITNAVGSALVIMNGNVGIGTWVPAYSLQINGNVGIGTSISQNIQILAASGGGSGAIPSYSFLGATTTGLAYGVGGGLIFDTAGVETLTIYTGSFRIPSTDTISDVTTGNAMLAFGQNNTATNTAGNELQITGALAGGTPILSSSGVDTNISIDIDPKGNGNVGIGTITPVAALGIVGNIGIGTGINSPYVTTTPPSGGMIVQGNVGIGSLHPGQALDVNGTARMTGFTLTGNGAGNGYIIIGNSVGVGSWMATTTLPVGTLNNGTTNQIAFYSAATTLSGSSSMVFNAPNVGLGTVTPLATLQVVGNIGIGTVANGDNFITSSPTKGGIIVEGNVGIGTWAPAKPLSVTGDTYLNGNIGIGTSFTTGGAALTILNGNVGIGTWGPVLPLSVIGDTYHNGNVGIGTSKTTTASLDVMNGNVGIGTWIPRGFLQVVGIGTISSGSGLVVTNSNVGIGTWIPAGTVTIENSTYIPNELLLNNGTTGVPLAFPNSYTPTLTVNDSELSGSRPLWFGYKNGATWDSFVTLGACGSFTQMCFDLGTSATVNSAIISNAGNLSIGGILNTGFSAADGNAVNVYFGNTGNHLIPNGNVGIGTTTPQGELIVMNGDVGIGTVAPRAALIVQNGNVGIGTANANYNLQVGGCATKDGTISCVDLAELIPSSEPVSAGDLVMLNPQKSVTVMKAVNTNNNLLFGVVTTEPAIVIEGSSVGIINGSGFKLQSMKPGIALAGRVPVKVNSENGVISEGDMITSSSMPGVGAKAVKEGRVVGMALEPLVGMGTALYQKIIVYVDPHWWQGTQDNADTMRSTVTILTQQVQELKSDLDTFKEENISRKIKK